MIFVAALGSYLTFQNAAAMKEFIQEESLTYVNDVNAKTRDSINETFKRIDIEFQSMVYGLNSYVTNSNFAPCFSVKISL